MESKKCVLPAEEKKIAVYGIGATGLVIVQELQNMGICSQIICLDKDPDRVKKFITDWSNITLIRTNGNGDAEKLIGKLKGICLLINSASMYLNVHLMRLCRFLRCHWMNFATRGDFDAEEKDFNDSFVVNGKIGLINFGIGPGLTNLMAAELIKGLEDVSISIFVAEHTETNKTIVLWNTDDLLNEATSPVSDSYNGEEKELWHQPFSDSVDYRFPEPIGKITCYDVNQNEGLMKKNLPNVEKIQVKIGGADIEKIIKKFLKKTEGRQKQRLNRFAKKESPPTPDDVCKMIKKGTLRNGYLAIAVEVSGKDLKKEKNVQRHANWLGPSLLDIQKKYPGRTHMSHPVGYMASLGVRILLNSGELKPGVWAPEQLPEKQRHFVFEKLAERHMPVHFSKF